MGVQTYYRPHGVVTRELRLPEEVFNPDSLKSFELIPLTNDHPPDGVNPNNYKGVSVGTVGDIAQDAQHVTALISVADAEAIESVLSGKQELSCGYFCEVVKVDGTQYWDNPYTGEKEAYTHIQKNIRANHVAIVDKGRAGASVAFRNDASQSFLGENMKTLKLDGKDFEVAPEVDAAFTALQIKADATQLKLDKVQSELASVSSPKHIANLVAARVALDEKIHTATGGQFKADAALSYAEAVKATVAFELKRDASQISDDYAAGMLDAMYALKKDSVKNPTTEALKNTKIEAVTNKVSDAAKSYNERMFGKGV